MTTWTFSVRHTRDISCPSSIYDRPPRRYRFSGASSSLNSSPAPSPHYSEDIRGSRRRGSAGNRRGDPRGEDFPYSNPFPSRPSERRSGTDYQSRFEQMAAQHTGGIGMNGDGFGGGDGSGYPAGGGYGAPAPYYQHGTQGLPHPPPMAAPWLVTQSVPSSSWAVPIPPMMISSHSQPNLPLPQQNSSGLISTSSNSHGRLASSATAVELRRQLKQIERGQPQEAYENHARYSFPIPFQPWH